MRNWGSGEDPMVFTAAHAARAPGAEAMHRVAIALTVIGAAGSMILMLRAGNPPLVLRVLFGGWVLSPFLGLLVVDRVSISWGMSGRRVLTLACALIAIGSLAVYGGVIPMPAASENAMPYLLVPLVSWLLIAATVIIGRRPSA
ncbi:MAG: hypothetical protein K2X99_09240 [Gemmatimonadaceae bacterium]|nr:hypothetical protein [Gemmatimonadaceae bacterium]